MVNSPLPFLFGAKKDVVKNRYWLRTATPPNVKNEYWLEAYPKRIEDARIYKKIEIIIDGTDFLPKSLHVYSANYNPAENELTSYLLLFANRRRNDPRDKVRDFLKLFVRPTKPLGWTRTELTPVGGTVNSASNPQQPNRR